MSRGNYAFMRQMLRSSSQPGTFSDAELRRYAEAWRMPGALAGGLNGYRAVFRNALTQGGLPEQRSQRVRVPTLILWGVRDIALSQDLARPSVDLCDDGELVFFPNATHWVQHDEAQSVNTLLTEFLQS